jgi:uncharacterized membrane protein
MDLNPATVEPVRYRNGAGSYAAFRGHPVHPMLVPLVVGTFVAALLADIAFASSHEPFFARAAAWLLLLSLVFGCIAAIPGMIDFTSVDRVRQLPIARAHAIGNSAFLVVVAIDYAQRYHDLSRVPSGGLVLTVLALILLVGSGWLGGAMVYRHGVGVSPGVGLGDETAAGSIGDTKLAARAERLADSAPAGSGESRDWGDPLVQPTRFETGEAGEPSQDNARRGGRVA